MRSHRLNSYHDGRMRITYCEDCAREDSELDLEECPGYPVPYKPPAPDKNEKQPELFNVDNLKPLDKAD